MNYFFVDFENVHTEGIGDMSLVKESDNLLIMYTENCKNVTLDIVEQASVKKVNIKAFKVSTGCKNALDFQLSTYLGYILGMNQGNNTKYYIVSKDTGFDRVCEFWNGMGFIVKRIPNLMVLTTESTKKKSTSKKKISSSDMASKEEMKQYLMDDENLLDVLEIFNKYKSKQAICNGIAQKLKDSKKAGDIYKKIKPLLKEKNKVGSIQTKKD